MTTWRISIVLVPFSLPFSTHCSSELTPHQKGEKNKKNKQKKNSWNKVDGGEDEERVDKCRKKSTLVRVIIVTTSLRR